MGRVALIAAKDFVDVSTIREVVLAAPEGTEFVIRSREAVRDPEAPPPEPGKQHKTLPLLDVLRELGIEPEVMELDPELKWAYMVADEEISGDYRSQVRDERIKNECDRVIVFRTPDTKTLDSFANREWYHEKMWPHIRTIERGTKAKKTHKKGRAVQ